MISPEAETCLDVYYLKQCRFLNIIFICISKSCRCSLDFLILLAFHNFQVNYDLFGKLNSLLLLSLCHDYFHKFYTYSPMFLNNNPFLKCLSKYTINSVQRRRRKIKRGVGNEGCYKEK